MQISRLFEIVYLLLNNENMTAKQLAERLGVSSRTIYRDVDKLSMAGIAVYMEAGRGGGIRLIPGSVLNKSLLSEQEQNEILNALQGLSQVGDEDAREVLRRLSGFFNKTANNWIEVDLSDWSFGSVDIFAGLKAAILDRRVVEFGYYNANGEKTDRRVEPVQLWFKARAWYLKGYCLGKQDMRVFKLLRVNNLVVTGESFDRRDSLSDEPRRETSHEPYVTMRLHISAKMAYRVHDEFAAHTVALQPDGSYIATVTWPEDSWIYGFLLSFGEDIKVLEPGYLRDIIKDKAMKIAGQYDCIGNNHVSSRQD